MHDGLIAWIAQPFTNSHRRPTKEILAIDLGEFNSMFLLYAVDRESRPS